MATTVAVLEAALHADTKKFDAAMSKSDKTMAGLGKTAGIAGAAIAGGLAVGAVFAVKAASNLSEQINKATVVFRGSERQIIAWSETTASSIGISQRAALEAAGTFGNMLVPMGFARGEAAKMSQRMVQLAADMASFNNASPEETLDALRSGLAGQTEPLRKFGVFLNEARIKEEAVRLGLMKTGGVLSTAAKAQATYSIMLKDTADAQGDFARTSGSLANQERIMKAQLEDTAAAFGMALIPAVQGALDVLLKLVGVVKDNEGVSKVMAVALAALSGALLLASASAKIYTSSVLLAVNATKGLRVAMALTPWGLAAVAAATLVEFLTSQGQEATKATEAQNDLAEAVRNYHRAVQEGESARKGLEESNLRLEAAEISVKRAMESRRQVDKDSTSTLLDRREADLRVSQALAERRDAEGQVDAATRKATTSLHRGKQAADEMAAATRTLTDAYTKNFKRSASGKILTEGLAGAFNRAQQKAIDAAGGVDEYANKLRGMAEVTRRSNPQLSRTQGLMADLSQAWGRVIDMPSAKAFVARFSVFTTVETNRRIPTGHGQHGGIVTRPTVALIGEAGPEAVVPLHKTPGSSPLPAGGGGVSIVVQNHGLISSPDQVVNLLRNAVAKWERSNGKAAFG